MNRGSLRMVSVTATPETEEAVVALLQAVSGQVAVVNNDPELKTSRVSVYLPQAAAWTKVKHARLWAGLEMMRKAGLHLGSARIAVERVRREDWAESWKRHFKPIEISHALLIRPSWSRRKARQGEAEVVLDPGLSFGTGQHPTTRFCLEQLVAARRPGRRQSFLDVGTGSGILALAAAKFGYHPVEGLDFDPDAIRVAQANARLNRVSDQVCLTRRDVARLKAEGCRTFDVVCANLTHDLLLAHQGKLIARVKSGGRLVLAGLLRTQFQAVSRAYTAVGLTRVARHAEGEWESGAFARPAACSGQSRLGR